MTDAAHGRTRLEREEEDFEGSEFSQGSPVNPRFRGLSCSDVAGYKLHFKYYDLMEASYRNTIKQIGYIVHCFCHRKVDHIND